MNQQTDMMVRSRTGRLAMTYAETIYVAVVDDDERFCRSLARLLRAAGMQPITYASAEAFLADDKHPQFDCLVLDVHLDGMSGIELGQRLAAERRVAPFICITSADEPALRTQAEAAGCGAFYRKTESGALVLDAIRRLTQSSDPTGK